MSMDIELRAAATSATCVTHHMTTLSWSYCTGCKFTLCHKKGARPCLGDLEASARHRRQESSTVAVTLRSLTLSAADQKETYRNKEGLKTKPQMQAQV